MSHLRSLGAGVTALLSGVSSHALAQVASDLPTGGQVAAGSAQITTSSPQGLTISQTSDAAIINWSSFNIGADASVHFLQPNANAAALNRVNGDTTSTIAGLLSANGRVMLVNPNGITITSTGTVNTSGFIASTYDILDEDFLAGNLSFRRTARSGAVENHGQIVGNDGAAIGLVGADIRNSGLIRANLGRVTLATGDFVTLDFHGDGMLSTAIPIKELADELDRSVGDLGREIEAGAFALVDDRFLTRNALRFVNIPTALSAQSVGVSNTGSVILGGLGGVIDQSGVISAAEGSVSLAGGRLVVASGSIDVTGSHGGQINIEGRDVLLAGAVNADGSQRAGSVTVDASGRILVTASSALTARGPIGGSVSVQADGNLFSSGSIDVSGADGAGGNVVVTGEDVALVAATISADGATGGGHINIGLTGDASEPQISARTVDISPTTRINADALDHGDGGEVRIWSQASTRSFARIVARGGEASGDGGFIETSSLGTVTAGGVVDASAPNGASGVYLLDPNTITISDVAPLLPFYQLINPGVSGDGFGLQVASLAGGRIVVTAPFADIGGASDAGAVYVFNAGTGALLSTISGSTADDRVGYGTTGSDGIFGLANGNFVILSPNWSNGANANAGAAVFRPGDSTTSGVVSVSNSLYGARAGDAVGSGGAVELVGPGFNNFAVLSPVWSSATAAQAGAVTWGSGSSGVVGAVSATNSLVGASNGDFVGGFGGSVFALSNGNYVVTSPNWDNAGIADAGAATWASGASGRSGLVSTSNSLHGSTSGDNVGSFGVTRLGNGGYVVLSPFWNNGAIARVGAATHVSASGALTGAVGSGNSLVGSNADDRAGGAGAYALGNGSYAVASPEWNGGRGAVTVGSGALTGTISAGNSLIGSTPGDAVGAFVTRLERADGAFVVSSPFWSDGALAQVGAITLVNGNGSTVGVVSTANSLTGSGANDWLGLGGVAALSDGNYVVSSPYWDRGGVTDAGAATWRSGSNFTGDTISITNSLIGSNPFDEVGGEPLGATGGVFALANGRYVVSSANWNGSRGAVTLGQAGGVTVGEVSTSNSLTGSTVGDFVGSRIAVLNDRDFVVLSSNWSGLRGAATLVDGALGLIGTVGAANSLVGATANDRVGGGGVVETATGDLLIRSPFYSPTGLSEAGAISYVANGASAAGVLSSANSVFGQTAFANIGQGSVAAGGATHFAYGSPVDGTVTVGITDPNLITFQSFRDDDITISPDFITRVLNTGTAVTLQANTDILLNANLIASNPSGNGGNLTLSAGRSILLNGNIVSDNGNVSLFANYPLVLAGIDPNLRDAGVGVITFGGGNFIDAGTGAIEIRVVFPSTGDITLGSLTGSTIAVEHGFTGAGAFAGGNIILPSGVVLTASDAGRAINLISTYGSFANSASAGAFNLTGGGHFGVLSDTPAATIEGLTNFVMRYNVADGNAFALLDVGQNFFAYRYAPVLTVTLDAFSRIYGDANPTTSGFSISGFVNGDTLATSGIGGAPGIITAATSASGVGTYAFTGSLGTLLSDIGYQFQFVGNNLTITPRPITVTVSTSRVYGDANPALTGVVTNGSLVNGDALTGGGATAATATSNVGSYAVTQGTLGASSNYAMTFVNGQLTVTPRPVTVTINPVTRIYGDANPAFGFTAAGVVNNDVLGLLLTSSATAASNVGAYDITANLASVINSNYSLNLAGITPGTLSVLARPITITVPNITQVRGETPPPLVASITSGTLVAGHALTGAAGPISRDLFGPGQYAISRDSLGVGSFTENYAITFNLGTITVTAPPNQTATNASQTAARTTTTSGGGSTTTAVTSTWEAEYNRIRDRLPRMETGLTTVNDFTSTQVMLAFSLFLGRRGGIEIGPYETSRDPKIVLFEMHQYVANALAGRSNDPTNGTFGSRLAMLFFIADIEASMRTMGERIPTY